MSKGGVDTKKLNIKLDSNITQQDLEGLVEGVERVNKMVIKGIEDMSNTVEWQEFVKKANDKYKT